MYLRKLQIKTKMKHSKPCPTMMCPSHKLHHDDGDPFDQQPIYWSTIWSLQYFTMTRPDIAFVVNKVSQFFQAPIISHWNACKRLLCYVVGTPSQGLKLTAAPILHLYAFPTLTEPTTSTTYDLLQSYPFYSAVVSYPGHPKSKRWWHEVARSLNTEHSHQLPLSSSGFSPCSMN